MWAGFWIVALPIPPPWGSALQPGRPPTCARKWEGVPLAAAGEGLVPRRQRDLTVLKGLFENGNAGACIAGLALCHGIGLRGGSTLP